MGGPSAFRAYRMPELNGKPPLYRREARNHTASSVNHRGVLNSRPSSFGKSQPSPSERRIKRARLSFTLMAMTPFLATILLTNLSLATRRGYIAASVVAAGDVQIVMFSLPSSSAQTIAEVSWSTVSVKNW